MGNDGDDEHAATTGALRFAVYKRLAGSLLLYLTFLTAVHVFWCATCAILAPPGGLAVTIFGRRVALFTAFELSTAGVFILARWRSTFCAMIAGFALPLALAAVALGARVFLGGGWYDEQVYGGAADWSNAKTSHIVSAFARAYYSHMLWSGFRGWLFLMGAGILGFYGKYCILATHRGVQHALSKIVRVAQSSACCLLGEHGGTFFFLALHVAAGGIVSAVLCSCLGFNDRFVDPSSGQIVEVYDRMSTFYLTPTPGSTLRHVSVHHPAEASNSKVTKLLLHHWYWTVFGLFNGAVAALLHILGDRNVLAPVQSRADACPSSNAAITAATNFGQNLLRSVKRSAAAAAVALVCWVILSVGTHWGKRVAGDADTQHWDEVGDLQLPLFDEDADGHFDSAMSIAGRLVETLLMLARVAWGIHFLLDTAQLALDECVGLPVDLATELAGVAGTGGGASGGDEQADTAFGLHAAVAVLDHTASSQFEYLLKCYHGGIDGFTADDHDLVKRRHGRGTGTGTASSLVRRSRRRRVGGTGGIIAGLGPSLGSGDVSSTDSDSESSLGSDPDEDGEAQTPWRREQRQGALRFHNVALRSVYNNHNAMSQHPSYRLKVPSAVLARFDDARCFRHPRRAIWDSAFRNSSPGGTGPGACRAGGENSAGSSTFKGVVGQLARVHALEGLRQQLKFHAEAHAAIHNDVLQHTRRHDSLALYHRSLWARIVSACTAHVDAFTLDALFASGSVLMPSSREFGEESVSENDRERSARSAGDGIGGFGVGLRWNHVYMIDSDELGEAVGSCCPRGCGRCLGLRPLADLLRSLRPYNSVSAYLLNYRAPQNFAPDAPGVTASVLNDFQAITASCEILVDLVLRGYEWEQDLEALAVVARSNGHGACSTMVWFFWSRNTVLRLRAIYHTHSAWCGVRNFTQGVGEARVMTRGTLLKSLSIRWAACSHASLARLVHCTLSQNHPCHLERQIKRLCFETVVADQTTTMTSAPATTAPTSIQKIISITLPMSATALCNACEAKFTRCQWC
eukprot:INCI6184.3.p1 GENE.INCI6184.3~~INCI6184.3.p1  ORF type:complete len:1029 (-),score=139.60 INCI6184.3:696-3782(-)